MSSPPPFKSVYLIIKSNTGSACWVNVKALNFPNSPDKKTDAKIAMKTDTTNDVTYDRPLIERKKPLEIYNPPWTFSFWQIPY